MTDAPQQPMLAMRLGVTVHVSPLRIRLAAWARRYPSPDAACLEDWLLDVANRRGARIVVREHADSFEFAPPPPAELLNEDLVAAICQLQGADRPQLLRLAAQLISRQILDMTALRRVAVRERVGAVLRAMAQEALRVDPNHHDWKFLAEAFGAEPQLRDVVMHWSRLSEPVMANGRCNAASWRLVA